jgi:REP element-mobilizing transposase RayT
MDVPRYAREKSESGIYHIMIRGINRQDIFEDNDDRQRFIETIKKYKTVSKYEVHGYCLMSNHVHMLIKEVEEPISMAIKRICGSYVYWYNMRYNRCGHLFQERYKSEIVEDEGYYLTVLRYIHQNPVNAGLSTHVKEYEWSSYREYIGKTEITDIDLALELFSDDRRKAVELFDKYMNEENDDKCLEYSKKSAKTDKEVRGYFVAAGVNNISDLQHQEKFKRDEIIRVVKSIDGVSIRQLSRITGIPKSVIDRM